MMNAAPSVQRLAAMAPAQLKPNRTGLPDALKSGVEALSGLSMDHVRVHRNSPEPAQLGAHAFARGSQIHLAPGQDRHLPHEAWHVVQQAQGRVAPTAQFAGMAINESPHLEREADRLGSRAARGVTQHMPVGARPARGAPSAVAQLLTGPETAELRNYFDLRIRAIGSPTSRRNRLIFAQASGQATLAAAKQYIDAQVRLWQQGVDVAAANPPVGGGGGVVVPMHRQVANSAVAGRFKLPTNAALYMQLVHMVEANHRNHPYATDFFHEKKPVMRAIMSNGGIINRVLSIVGALFSEAPQLIMDYRTQDRPRIRVIGVEIILNPQLAGHFGRAQGSLAPHLQGTQMLAFGHTPAMIDLIARQGMRPDLGQYHGMKGHGALGRGAYVTDRVDKAISYSGNDPGTQGQILLTSVLPGRSLVLRSGNADRHETHNEMVRGNRSAMNKTRAEGTNQQDRSAYDSIVGQENHPSGASAVRAFLRSRRGEFDSRETLIRNADQMLPTFIIHYEVQPTPQSRWSLGTLTITIGGALLATLAGLWWRGRI